jgi:hypothetical protein
METSSPTPDAILQTAFGFWNSKVLLTAVTFDLFSTLGERRLTGREIGKKLRRAISFRARCRRPT